MQPDGGTATVWNYDADNRAIWTTNQFDPSSPNLPVLTHTIYNALGQQTETDTFDGGTISINSHTVSGATIYSASISTSTVDGVLTPTGATFISSTKTFYDGDRHAKQGRVGEQNRATHDVERYPAPPVRCKSSIGSLGRLLLLCRFT